MPASAPDVLDVLVKNHRRFLKFLERRVGSLEIAEDILQQAFVRSTQRPPTGADQEGVVNWFYRLLRNALIDHYRRGAVEQRAWGQVAQETPAAVDSELRSEVCQCIHGLLPTLKHEYGEVIRRVDLNEQSVTQAADELGVTANNAMVRLHRARKALKAQLERSCGTCATHGCLDCSCGKPKRS